MIVSAIEIEGVGPFRARRRFAIGPGSVVLLGGNESGKSTLLDVVALLLDPDPALEIAPFLRTNPPPERSEAVLELTDAEGPFVVRADFDAREFSLQEGDGPILEGPPEAVANAIRSRLGLPAQGAYERLFTVSSEKVTPAARGGRLGDAQRALEAKAAARGLRAARAQAEALRARLAVAREHEVQRGLREAEVERLRALEAERADQRDAREELVALEERLRQTSALAGAPADLEERVADYARLTAELADGEAQIAARARELADEQAALAAPSVARRTALLVGIALAAGGVALWGLGSLLAPIVLGFGIAALGAAAFASVRARLGLARVGDARAAQADRARMLRHRFELETVAVRSLATALGLDSPADLLDAIARHREAVERRDRMRTALAERGEPQDLDAEIRAVRARLAAIAEPEVPADAEDATALRVQLETAERELRLAERASHDAAARAADEEIAPAAWMVEELLRAAAACHAREPEEVWDDAETLAGAYVRALSGRAYAALRRKGEARWLLEREGREALPLEDATGSAAEILHHAVQLALVERAALARPLPVLLDDPFVRLDATRKLGAARCVRRLGAVTQVLLATSDPLFERGADRVVRLAGDAPPA